MTLPNLEQTGVAVFFGALLVSVGLVVWDMLGSKGEHPNYTAGGAPERFGVLIFLYMIVVQAIGYLGESAGPEYSTVDDVSVLSDLIGLTGFLALALNARRFWPLFCAALQGCSTIFHYAREIIPDIIPLAYSIQKSTPTTLALLIVLGALIYRRWRVSRQGWDVDWSVAGYSQLYRKTDNRTMLWDYLKTFGRSWFGIPLMIWGFLVIAYCVLVLSVGGAFPAAFALLGVATLVVGYRYHDHESRRVEDKTKLFNANYGAQR
ncbi:hypothetical protein [Erythrobacter crassostreae]|uniref:Uncharacterized protein n=1 Tax=Erythrobacter crassostreae TaxID=2828328 RepID=A0A9X1F3K4_9SPHN|nr:hypothetical protein [Erythrobacter crassostrea]MBV7258678.1 hypothetical protein [Erythrobacter crassostrea]